MEAQLKKIRNMQVPLQVVVGNRMSRVEDIASMGKGSIIQLDRLVGEPADLLAAGKLIARGEVVVIEDTFGFRITQLLDYEE